METFLEKPFAIISLVKCADQRMGQAETVSVQVFINIFLVALKLCEVLPRALIFICRSVQVNDKTHKKKLDETKYTNKQKLTAHK